MSALKDSYTISLSPLVLTHPTVSERLRIWKATYPHWGDALTFDDYITREVKNLEFCQEGQGNFDNWILTDDSAADQRPLFSSCETFKKRAFICGKEGGLRDGTCCAAASVFTFPEYQGRGYAKNMMTLLGQEIRKFADFSVLWSDIGPKFYHSVGWKPFESTFIQLPAISHNAIFEDGLEAIKIEDLPHLIKRDEKILLKQLEVPSDKIRVLVLPDLDTIKWHLFHEAFSCQHVLSRTPTIHGAIYTSPNHPHAQIWAIWTRKIYGQECESNTFHVLRFVIEDENISSDALKSGISALCRMAQKEANEWACGTVEIWNPSDRVRKAAEGIEGLGAKLVTRKNHHLSSMLWLTEGSIDEVDWFCNEGFAWC
ncbi:hypothetical protein AbraIFM66950_008276 [Aspergillus brasiliensis]|nr:hypothetical protein AbraIFM66950_008276 [Aspergillus brasiliensis]